NAAKAASNNQINSTYYASLWNSTQSLTRARIDSATVATASFVYTAWILAGQPLVPGSSGVPPGPIPIGPHLEAGPSPFADAISVSFGGAGPVSVDVFD